MGHLVLFFLLLLEIFYHIVFLKVILGKMLLQTGLSRLFAGTALLILSIFTIIHFL